MGSGIINFEPDPIIDFQIDFQPEAPPQKSIWQTFLDNYRKTVLPKSDVSEFENVRLPNGTIISKRKSETVEQAIERRKNRPDSSMFDFGKVFDVTAENISNQIGMSDFIPDMLKQGLGASASYLFAEVPRTITELLAQPETVATPSVINKLFSPRIPPPRIPPALPPGRLGSPAYQLNPDTFIGGPSGGSGQVIRDIDIIPELRPQAEAILTADRTPTNIPTRRFVDLGERTEAERLANVFYTGHEQGGGTSLTLPDRPNMPLSPITGDTRLGFESISRAGQPVEGAPIPVGQHGFESASRLHPPGVEPLPYPLNVVPEAVRPRSAQTVTRALAGDVPKPGPKIDFQIENELPIPKTPEVPPVRDLKGGTAAIEFGKEKILESAKPIFRKASRNTGVPLEPNTVTAVPPPLKEPIVKLVAEESRIPSPWRSVRTVLRELSPELWRREVRSVQLTRQYDSKWVPVFENALRKLTKIEKENFGGFVEGTIPVTSKNVEEAVNAWRAVESSIGDEAVSRRLRLYKGKEHVPFQKNMENYWPHIPKETLSREGLLERLMKGGMSRNEALRVIKHYQNQGEIVIGAQHARVGKSDIPYRLDADAGLQHIRAMSKRIAQHREFGPLDIEGKGVEGVADLIEATKDPNLTLTLMRRLVGREERANPTLNKWLDRSRKYTAMTKLQNFTFPNVILGQTSTIMKGARHPIASISEITNLFKRRYRADLAKSGAWQNFSHALVEELQGRDIYLIGAGETFNRGISAAVGKAVAKAAFQELKANPNSKKAIGELTELVLEDIPALLKQEGLTEAQLQMAAGRMAEIAQGLNVPGNLPFWASQPVRGPLEFAGQLMWQLKKMGYQQTKTIYDSIKANPTVNIPLWLVLSQVAGELTGDTKTFLRGLWKGDPETEVANRGNWWIDNAGVSQANIQRVSDITGVEPQLIARILDNWTQAFFLGLPADLLMSSSYGPAGLADALFGPIFGDIRKFVYNASRGNVKALTKDLIRMMPIPGSSGLSELITEEE